MFYWKTFLSWIYPLSKCNIWVNWIRYHRATQIKTKEQLKELLLHKWMVAWLLGLPVTLSRCQSCQRLLVKHQLVQPLPQLDLSLLLIKIHKKRLKQLLMVLKQMKQNKAMVLRRKIRSRKKKIQNLLIDLKKKSNLLIMMMMKS